MLPLDHVSVLDLTRLAPGPHCTMLLADLGANVLRIEEPGGGRRARMEKEAAAKPTAEEEAQQIRRAAHSALDRNKRSIILNLKAPEAKEVFAKLAAKADVIVEGYRPGVVRRLGVDYETLSKTNPRLIYCSISGFGQDGPYAQLVGHDLNYIAVAGALSMIGPKDGPPVVPGNLLGDYAGGGLHAAFAILAALIARDRTGRGQYIDLSMTDGVVTLMASAFSEYFTSGVAPRRGAHRLTGGVPHYNVYKTKDDKYISVGCNEPWFFENLCRALGGEAYADAIFGDAARRQEAQDFLSQAFATRTRDEWFSFLREKEVAVAPVYEMAEAADDPQLRARQMITEVAHPTLGPVKQVGLSVKLSETPGAIRRTAPLPGEHTDEVLRELGYDEEAIRKTREAGAVG